MRTKTNCFWLAMLLCGLMVRQTSVAAEEPLKTFEAVGTVKIQGEKIVDAREAAISLGLAAAVDRAILEQISAETAAANFSAITELFYVNVNQFVQGYKVLAESRGSGFYRVMVQAGISSAAIQKQLTNAGIALGKKILPSVLLMVSDQRLDSPDAQYWWGSGAAAAAKPVAVPLLSRVLSEKGFGIVGHEVVGGSEALVPVHQNSNPGNAQVAEIGAKAGADMVIAGSLTFQRVPTAPETAPKTVKAVISLRAVRSGSGEELAAVEQMATVPNAEDPAGIDLALATLGKAACEELSKQMASAWQKQARKSASVELLIEGTSQLGNYSAFRSVLSKVSGVKHVQIKEMKADQSTLIVEYPNGARQLADALMLKPYDGFSITIPEVTQNQLKIILVRGQQ
ncbi:MAG: hypothetical protein HY881_06980 [Deltaproteobacteria bacterium]|nr:hypothetical protein [Deltaproteobacteria bacterium]